ncbi:tyrosyl-DNA phosphodiesterase 2-like [Anneissia japonica]|uniref:tyrosyl-DNA phosphodiesterase 2-like n=1 Tax=Anneissia japonica TaxID=1529436 RepID=UPI0014256970|nr:tyrosyl-DNA phosphodiesterase 2-like [Anneissia japonica]
MAAFTVDDHIASLFAEFCLVTGATEDEALEYLQKKDWQVVDAINLYFDTVANQPDDMEAAAASLSAKDSCGGSTTQQQGEKKIKLVTWNIDGLDDKDLMHRTKAVCSTIERLDPDIVFLQEVIVDTASYIEKRCQRYKVLKTSNTAYFTAMMFKKSSVTILSNSVQPFENTTMMRMLQKVQVKCAGLDLLLMNSHLESTKEKHAERKEQFKIALEEMANASRDTVVLFGGDTNLRDSEVSRMGGIPGGIVDLWELFGRPEDSKYTWDTQQNNNLNWPYPNKPRIRFDRLFLRQAETASQVSLQTFKLIGNEWIAAVDRFPSDHFGIFCDFKVN